jgi:hypothetical protein
MNTITIPGISPWILVLIVLWTIPWMGVAMWKAARLSHKWWFVILLVVHTAGILDIIYIFLIARKYSVETETVSAPEPVRVSEPAEVTSVSQTIKTTEVKTTVTSPEKDMAEKTKSESVSELEK